MSAPFSSDQSSPQKSALKNPLLYSTVTLFCVAAYVVFILYTRHESARRYEEQTKARQDAQRRAEDTAAVEQLGGSELAIRAFYVSPRGVERGQSAQLCYDVANATQVTLDPPVGAVWGRVTARGKVIHLTGRAAIAVQQFELVLNLDDNVPFCPR